MSSACALIEDLDQPAQADQESSMGTLRVAKVQRFCSGGNPRFWSDCVDAQTNLNPPCTHMPTCTLCRIPAYINMRGFRGRRRGLDPPPLKNHKDIVFFEAALVRIPWKFTNGYQASIQCQAISGSPAKTPFKWRFDGKPMKARL